MFYIKRFYFLIQNTIIRVNRNFNYISIADFKFLLAKWVSKKKRKIHVSNKNSTLNYRFLHLSIIFKIEKFYFINKNLIRIISFHFIKLNKHFIDKLNIKFKNKSLSVDWGSSNGLTNPLIVKKCLKKQLKTQNTHTLLILKLYSLNLHQTKLKSPQQFSSPNYL